MHNQKEVWVSWQAERWAPATTLQGSHQKCSPLTYLMQAARVRGSVHNGVGLCEPLVHQDRRLRVTEGCWAMITQTAALHSSVLRAFGAACTCAVGSPSFTLPPAKRVFGIAGP